MATKKNFKVMKVFDCQDMPDKLCQEFLELFQFAGNGAYVYYHIAAVDWSEKPEFDRKYQALDQWLIENGAIGPKDEDDAGEEVLISYWW